MAKLPSYRNQSTDLQNKSIDCFLYDGTLAFNEIVESKKEKKTYH